MINYKKEYIMSLLSNLSYLDFKTPNNLIDINLSEQNIIIENLFKEYLNNERPIQNYKYSLDFFSLNFKINQQDTYTSYNGFSATEFELINDINGTDLKKGQIFVAYRGTEVTFADIVTDIGLVITSKLKFSWSQETQALDFLTKIIEKNDFKKNIYVTGHSLGGYLGARSVHRLEPDYLKYINSVSTFNAAGFTILDGGLTKDSHYYEVVSKINNFYSSRDINVTAGDITDTFGQKIISVFNRLGPRYGINTENESMMGNHGIVHFVNTMGFFSVLENIVINLNINNIVKYSNINNDEAKKIHALNIIMMQAVAENKDYLLALDALAWKILHLLGLESKNIDIYPSKISQFISLDDFFRENDSYRLAIIDSELKNIQNIDNNNNRSLIYSLVNDISYYAIVPPTFNTGIFDRTIESNNLYNVEKYSQEYIQYRTLYNEIYTKVLEDKTINDLKPTFKKEILNDSLYSKFAFIDQEHSNPNGDSKIIFVNTTEKEYQEDTANNIKIIYFKKHPFGYFNTFKKNSIIFDTPLNDQFNIFGDSSIIRPTDGINVINIAREVKDISIEIEKNNKGSIYNNSFFTSKIIFKDNSLQNLRLQGANEYIVPSIRTTNNSFKLYTNNTDYFHFTGFFNIETKDGVITYNQIIAMLTFFSESFLNEKGSRLIVDDDFINEYTELTKYKFKSNNLEDYNPQGITKLHAEYIKNQIEQYKLFLEEVLNGY